MRERTTQEMLDELVELFYVCHDCSNTKIEWGYVDGTDVSELVSPCTEKYMRSILERS